MWLPNIFLGGKLTIDYHKLLPNWKTVYIPAPKSKKISLKIVWGNPWVKGKEGLITDTSPTIVFTESHPAVVFDNPLQLRPSSNKNNFISFKNSYGKYQEEAGRTTIVTQEIKGQSYSKEVPVKVQEIERTFIYYTPDSQIIPWPIIANRVDYFEDTYQIYKSKSITMQELQDPFIISIIQQFLLLSGQPEPFNWDEDELFRIYTWHKSSHEWENPIVDMIWYNPHTFIGTPINWNPLTKNISDCLSQVHWGEYFSEDYIVQDEWTIPEKQIAVRFLSAKEGFEVFINEWIEENIGNFFNKEVDDYGDSSWDMDPNWELHLGEKLLDHESWGNESQASIEEYVNATVEFYLLHSFETNTTKYLKDHIKEFRGFLWSPCMKWIFALQFPTSLEPYISEYLVDYRE